MHQARTGNDSSSRTLSGTTSGEPNRFRKPATSHGAAQEFQGFNIEESIRVVGLTGVPALSFSRLSDTVLSITADVFDGNISQLTRPRMGCNAWVEH